MSTEDRSRAPRAFIAIGVIAVVGAVGGWGVALRAKPQASTLDVKRAAAPASARPRGELFVHVAGAVRKPGVYRLESGSRFDDAVRAAGGAVEGANLDAVNLAARVRDGDKVVVPVRGTGGGAEAPAEAGGKVNLNTATVADLEDLPGVGPALAQRIFDHRAKEGPFRTIEDLRKVSGIGPKKYEQIAPLVTV